MTSTLAHLSDLHVGEHPRNDAACSALVQMLVETRVDHVIVSGDITHRGLRHELARFYQLFAPLADRLTVVPGNHDRLGDDAARALMFAARVQTVDSDGLYIVRVDSTGPHNRYVFAGHGMLTERDLDDIDDALDAAPRGALVTLALHHHPVALPEEMRIEKLARWLSLPFAAELALGRRLIELLHGRCDMVLHGHRHVPCAYEFFSDERRPLGVFNAGSSSQLGRARMFSHANGALHATQWLVNEAVRRAA
jgi:3',5'-cyclic AMP phosphodiesterase CpdA